jgi:hypothetical protein
LTCPDCGAPLDVVLDVSARFELRRMADGSLAIGTLSDTPGHLRRLAARDHGTRKSYRLYAAPISDGEEVNPSPVAICAGPARHVFDTSQWT